MSKPIYRILIVDDDPMVRDLTIRNCERLNFECDSAVDGSAAIDKCAATSYDAVITDLKMPNRNGHSLAVELLEQPSRPVVIVVTALADARLTRDLVARGVDRIFRKPIEQLQLASCARQLIDRRRARARDNQPDSVEVSGGDEFSAGGNDESASLSDVQPARGEDVQCETEAASEVRRERNPETETQDSGSNELGPKCRRILIVDDDPMVREIVSRSFSGAGLFCDSAEDGQIAAEMFTANRYDAVVTDLRMPNRNGHSLAVDLVKHPSKPVVIVVTAMTERRIEADLLARGVVEIAHKPIDHAKLAERVLRRLNHDSIDSADPSASGSQTTLSMPVSTSFDSGSCPHTPLEDRHVNLYFYCSSYEHTPDEISSLVAQDPALTALVIRQANASTKRWSHHIDDLRDAVSVLGQRRIGELALETSTITDR
jgi:DNA-binding response OmpR family regulator